MKSIFIDALFGAKTALDAALVGSTAFFSTGQKIILPKKQQKQQIGNGGLSSLSSLSKGKGYSRSNSPVSKGRKSPTSSLSMASAPISREDVSMVSFPIRLLWFSPLEVLDYCTKNVVMLSPMNVSADLFARINHFDEVNFYRFSLMLNAEDGIGDWISQLIDTYPIHVDIHNSIALGLWMTISAKIIEEEQNLPPFLDQSFPLGRCFFPRFKAPRERKNLTTSLEEKKVSQEMHFLLLALFSFYVPELIWNCLIGSTIAHRWCLFFVREIL